MQDELEVEDLLADVLLLGLLDYTQRGDLVDPGAELLALDVDALDVEAVLHAAHQQLTHARGVQVHGLHDEHLVVLKDVLRHRLVVVRVLQEEVPDAHDRVQQVVARDPELRLVVLVARLLLVGVRLLEAHLVDQLLNLQQQLRDVLLEQDALQLHELLVVLHLVQDHVQDLQTLQDVVRRVLQVLLVLQRSLRRVNDVVLPLVLHPELLQKLVKADQLRHQRRNPVRAQLDVRRNRLELEQKLPVLLPHRVPLHDEVLPLVLSTQIQVLVPVRLDDRQRLWVRVGRVMRGANSNSDFVYYINHNYIVGVMRGEQRFCLLYI